LKGGIRNWNSQLIISSFVCLWNSETELPAKTAPHSFCCRTSSSNSEPPTSVSRDIPPPAATSSPFKKKQLLVASLLSAQCPSLPPPSRGRWLSPPPPSTALRHLPEHLQQRPLPFPSSVSLAAQRLTSPAPSPTTLAASRLTSPAPSPATLAASRLVFCISGNLGRAAPRLLFPIRRAAHLSHLRHPWPRHAVRHLPFPISGETPLLRAVEPPPLRQAHPPPRHSVFCRAVAPSSPLSPLGRGPPRLSLFFTSLRKKKRR
jgi:hypothetical protein